MSTRVILRSCRDGRYVLGENAWTERADLALNFEKATRADEYVRLHQIPDMEVIIYRENAPMLRTPLSPKTTQPARD